MNIDNLTAENIINDEVFNYLYSIKEPFKRTQEELRIKSIARKLSMQKDWENLYRQYKIMRAKEHMKPSDQVTEFTDQPIQINCGDWITSDTGVIKNEFNFRTCDIQVTEASRIPVLPSEVYENMDTGIEKVKLSYYKNGWKSMVVEKVTISNQSKIVELSNMGLEVTTDTAKHLVRYLHDCITLNDNEVLPRYKSVGRMGWVENDFMPYNQAIRFDGEKENKYLYKAIHNKGDLGKWIKTMSKLRKNLQFRLLLNASFSSVLLSRLSALPFVFHLWGGTGAGKTVGLMCAASVWGNPAMGKMTRTMNMTANSMLSTAAFLHDLPFIGDELQTIKSRWENYDNLIMKITEGIDRGRMQYDKVLDTKTWNCAFIFSGEEPCTKMESGGGAINRVIDVECTEPILTNGNKIVSFINENYGHAGELFIQVVKNFNNLETRYQEIYTKILDECDTTEKQALSMAVLLLTDEITSKFIFTGEPLEISDISKFLMSAKMVDVSERAYEYVISLVSANVSNFDSTKFAGECWGKFEECYIWFNKQILIRELNKVGFSFEAIKKKWFEKKYLEKDARGKFQHQRKVNGVTSNFIKIVFINEENPFTKG